MAAAIKAASFDGQRLWLEWEAPTTRGFRVECVCSGWINPLVIETDRCEVAMLLPRAVAPSVRVAVAGQKTAFDSVSFAETSRGGIPMFSAAVHSAAPAADDEAALESTGQGDASAELAAAVSAASMEASGGAAAEHAAAMEAAVAKHTAAMEAAVAKHAGAMEAAAAEHTAAMEAAKAERAEAVEAARRETSEAGRARVPKLEVKPLVAERGSVRAARFEDSPEQQVSLEEKLKFAHQVVESVDVEGQVNFAYQLLRNAGQPLPEDLAYPSSEQKEILQILQDLPDRACSEDGSQAHDDRWSFSKWLQSLNLTDVLADEILAPLKDEHTHPALEKEYARLLGQREDPAFIVAMLHHAMSALGGAIWNAARKLTLGGREDEMGEEWMNSKFFDDCAEGDDCASLSYGAVNHFFQGLDSMVGPPNPNLNDTMLNEHCFSKDSTKRFQVRNYGTRTTPMIEYWFVADPSDEKLQELELNEWPVEEKRYFPDNPGTGENARAKRREPRPPQDFAVQLADCNGQLQQVGSSESVVEAELVAGRLYTGPMFQKYNFVLREVGKLRSEQGTAFLSAEQIGGHLVDADQLGTHSKGNLYTTTLHVVNSLVIKLSKLTKATKVYRGISRRKLPSQLRERDGHNVRGGVEFGFMSCSIEREEALKYAKADDTAILLEMQMGMIDRGADISWLSQYPHEAEVLWTPLTALEVTDYCVNEEGVLVVTMRPSSNLQAKTIEQVVAKMQGSHLQLLDLLTSDLRFAGVPADVLVPLSTLEVKANRRDPEWFNSTRNYEDATKEAFDQQMVVFKSLESEIPIKMRERPEEIRAVAMFAARCGAHATAVKLLCHASQCQPRSERNSTPQPVPGRSSTPSLRRASVAGSMANFNAPNLEKCLEWVTDCDEATRTLLKVAFSLLSAGLMQPWPATLVELGRHATEASGPRLQPKVFARLLKAFFASSDPFRLGAGVLVRSHEDKWTQGKVHRRQQSTMDVMVNGKQIHVDHDKVLKPDNNTGAGALLRAAARAGEAELTQLILDAGVSAMRTDENANTALLQACKLGQTAVCRVLLKAAPEAKELRNRRRESAYDIAVSKQHSKVIRLLKPSLSDRDVAFEDEESVRALAERFAGDWKRVVAARYKMIRIYLERKVADVLKEILGLPVTDNGMTPLMLACRVALPPSLAKSGANEAPAGAAAGAALVERLLDAVKEADPPPEWGLTSTTKSGCTALMMAAEEGNLPVVKVLLEAGALVNACDKDGRTPLFDAAQRGHLDVMQELLKRGADPNILRPKNLTVLMEAAQYGHTELVKELIVFVPTETGIKRVDVNAVNTRGESALTFCARYGHTKTVEALLDRGVDVAKLELEKPFWTSLHRAAANGHEVTARMLLRDLHDSIDPNLLTEEQRRKQAVAQRLLDHQDDKGVTALMAAARSNHASMVALLLTAGADDALKSNEPACATAYFMAAELGQREALEVLLKHTVNSEDCMNSPSFGWTPLMAAVAGDHEGAARALLNAKVETDPFEVGHAEVDRAFAEFEGSSDGRITHEELLKGLQTLSGCKSGNDERALALVGASTEKELFAASDCSQFALQFFKTKILEENHDALCIAATRGNEVLTKLLLKHNVTKRYQQAKAVAEKHGHTHLAVYFESDLKNTGKRPTRAPRRKSSAAGRAAVAIDVKVDSMSKLTFERCFRGQLGPPRPTQQQLKECGTPCGPLIIESGVVVQRGNYNAYWLRAGCVPHVPWHRLWESLMKHIEQLLEHEKQRAAEGQIPAAIYVAVSQRSMQAVDFTWLAKKDFAFHHHIEAGHAVECDGEEAIEDPNVAEFVYYCWPNGTGTEDDMVPVYATSIEGATGLLLSQDEKRVLLVWERGGWSTPGGAVNAGEGKVAALAREIREEIKAEVDVEWGAYYLGGWQEGRSREGIVNDNFSAFVVKLKSDSFKTDDKEIKEAQFFEWEPLLQSWIDDGRPEGYKVNGRKMGKNTLVWLETWKRGGAMNCRLDQKVLYGGMKGAMQEKVFIAM